MSLALARNRGIRPVWMMPIVGGETPATSDRLQYWPALRIFRSDREIPRTEHHDLGLEEALHVVPPNRPRQRCGLAINDVWPFRHRKISQKKTKRALVRVFCREGMKAPGYAGAGLRRPRMR
jgi:hypothetical protein